MADWVSLSGVSQPVTLTAIKLADWVSLCGITPCYTNCNKDGGVGVSLWGIIPCYTNCVKLADWVDVCLACNSQSHQLKEKGLTRYQPLFHTLSRQWQRECD